MKPHNFEENNKREKKGNLIHLGEHDHMKKQAAFRFADPDAVCYLLP
jgi:hypothetical protein